MSRLAALLLVLASGCSALDPAPPVQTSTLTGVTLTAPEAIGDTLLAWAAEDPQLSVAQNQEGRLVILQPGQAANRVILSARDRSDGLTELRMDYEFALVAGQTRTLPLDVLGALGGFNRGVLPLPADGSEPCMSVEDWQREQTREPDPDRVPTPNPVEVEPVLIGGLSGLQRRVQYPENLRRAGMQGVVAITFDVDESGAVQCPRVILSPHPSFGDAALRAVETAQFEPGMQGGRPVRVRFLVPISFALR